MAYMEVDGVYKRFGSNEVLRGVDVDVIHQVVCLIGTSGSGKSTLLRCINALEDIDGGVIRLGGDRRQRPRCGRQRACARTSASCSRATTCSRT